MQYRGYTIVHKYDSDCRRTLHLHLTLTSLVVAHLQCLIAAIQPFQRTCTKRGGSAKHLFFLCGSWSPGESCFICLKYCVLASCLTSKAPETYRTSLRLLIQKFPVIFLWPSHSWCSSFEERRNRYQAIQSCWTLVIPKKPLVIITPHKHQTNQPRSPHFQRPIVMMVPLQ